MMPKEPPKGRPPDALSLVIHHNIHLTREQRYRLHQGEFVDCVGVCVPVWVSEDVSSEPAREVFCQYRIGNTGAREPIKLQKGGFEIILPSREPITPPNSIDNETWRTMDEHEKEELVSFQVPGLSSLNLLDVKDGGTAALMYRENSRIRYDDNLHSVTIIHLIQIRSIEELQQTSTSKPRWADNLADPSTNGG